MSAVSCLPFCVRYGCWRTPLKFMKAGESHPTGNGFFTIQISGYYCPRCGAGYGPIHEEQEAA